MRYILALAVLTVGCSPSSTSEPSVERDIAVLSVAPSPDGSRSAVAYSDMGGGAAGWCYVCVDVVGGAFTPQRAKCGQSQQWFRCTTEVKLAWQSATEVLATYDGQPATELQLLQAAASSPGVRIRYEVAR